MTDATVTVGIGFLVNLLLLAFAIGKSQQKTAGEISNIKRDLNGLGKKNGKIILYLSETADGSQRERLTEILREP